MKPASVSSFFFNNSTCSVHRRPKLPCDKEQRDPERNEGIRNSRELICHRWHNGAHASISNRYNDPLLARWRPWYGAALHMHSRCLDWTERYSQTARSKSRWAAIAGFMLVLMRPNTLSGAVQGCCWASCKLASAGELLFWKPCNSIQLQHQHNHIPDQHNGHHAGHREPQGFRRLIVTCKVTCRPLGLHSHPFKWWLPWPRHWGEGAWGLGPRSRTIQRRQANVVPGAKRELRLLCCAAKTMDMYRSNSHRIWWAPMRDEASKNFGPRPRHRSSKRSSAARKRWLRPLCISRERTTQQSGGRRKEVQETFAPVLTWQGGNHRRQKKPVSCWAKSSREQLPSRLIQIKNRKCALVIS